MTKFGAGWTTAGMLASSCAAMIASMVPAGAQVAPPPTAAPIPPRSALPTREDLRPVPQAPEGGAPRLSVVGDIERSPCPLADPKFDGITVPVNSVSFNNLKGATAEEMRPAWASYAGTRQPVSVLCEIRDAAATILREKGYLAAVQVPTQRIENGEIRMEMLYARVTTIRARGETKGGDGIIARYLGRLNDEEIFDRNRAERYLLLARDLPGYTVQLTLKPAGTGPGDLIGEVTVVRLPYAVDATVQNLSSRAAGRWGGQVRAQFFGLTGMGDATSIAYYTTSDFQEQRILQLGHEFRLGSEGLKIAGQFTHAWTDPDIGAVGNPLTVRTIFATLEASYPIVRRQSRSLSVGGGMDLVNQRVDFAGVPLTRDRLRVAFARLSGEAIDLRSQSPRWRAAGTVEVRKGLTILDATDCGTQCTLGLGATRGDASGALVRFSGVGEVALGKFAALSIAPRAQFAFDPLFAFEGYTGGNYTIGRGFDPGTISGDSGIGASVELRSSGFRLGRDNGLMLRPFLFADVADAWNKRPELTGPARGLLSLGGGLRAELSNRLRLEGTLAVPTDTWGITTERSVRFLISLTTRLLPWSARP
ncbi:MAG: ShlB/FhaC/HecB family hemolysin secretion/activation protein [Sphingobium sp.]